MSWIRWILGDKFYQKNIDRSVLISTIESYELARAKGIEVILDLWEKIF